MVLGKRKVWDRDLDPGECVERKYEEGIEYLYSAWDTYLDPDDWLWQRVKGITCLGWADMGIDPGIWIIGTTGLGCI